MLKTIFEAKNPHFQVAMEARECLVYTEALTGSFGEIVVVKQGQARWSWILNRAYRSETYGDKMEGGVEGIELVGTGIKTASCFPVREEWTRVRMTQRSDIQAAPFSTMLARGRY